MSRYTRITEPMYEIYTTNNDFGDEKYITTYENYDDALDYCMKNVGVNYVIKTTLAYFKGE